MLALNYYDRFVCEFFIEAKKMGSSIIMAGLGMAAIGDAGRYAVRAMPQVNSFGIGVPL